MINKPPPSFILAVPCYTNHNYNYKQCKKETSKCVLCVKENLSNEMTKTKRINQFAQLDC